MLPGTLSPDKLRDALTAALAPFDETLELPRYVEYTKQQLIDKGRREIQEYRDGLYARYLADPIKYLTDCRNPGHARYLAGESDDGGFPAKLKWSDEQVYTDGIRWYEPEDIGTDGEVYSTSNPKATWDWWMIGGRWRDAWRLKAGATSGLASESSWASDAPKSGHTDCARLTDIEPDSIGASYALLGLDGKWVAKGDMGWFGMSRNENDDWPEAFKAALADIPADSWVVNVDAHI
ncbi:hypothetical protein [Mycobacterium sp. NPDC050853]|uniref:hypothetical protein n=1 Tax=Mycobacterium sp. NPDC050853 TaxID=3155160 RepID=UPI00340056A2